MRKPDTFILEIQLREANIPVWRIIEVSSKTTLHQLHLLIQVAMGWTCSHLYEFKIGNVYYQHITPDSFIDEEDDKMVISSEDIKLIDLKLTAGKRFSYEYDFGDSWIHDIYVKAFVPNKRTVFDIPCCSAGAMACPPENIGGIFAYNQLVQFRLFKTPIGNPELEQYFKKYDVYEVDALRNFTFDSHAKRMGRRAYEE